MCPDKIVPIYVNIYLFIYLFMWMTSFLNNFKLVLVISFELLLIGER